MNANIWDSIFIDDAQYQQLKELAKPERWDYIKDETNKTVPILRNYIAHTYKRLFSLQQSDAGYMIRTDDYICFNTGLYTKNYERIYALSVRNLPGYKQEWKLKGFYSNSAYELSRISVLPERARYFQDISEVYYDTKYDLRIRVDHILNDERNRLRLPEEFRDNKMLPMLLGHMAIDYAKMRIDENYKTAIPQFFDEKVQFLIPISLHDPAVVDLALAVSREGNTYTGRTCLTLDMAYNNARLIAKPESDWL